MEDLNALKDIKVTQQLKLAELKEFSKDTYRYDFLQSNWQIVCPDCW